MEWGTMMWVPWWARWGGDGRDEARAGYGGGEVQGRGGAGGAPAAQGGGGVTMVILSLQVGSYPDRQCPSCCEQTCLLDPPPPKKHTNTYTPHPQNQECGVAGWGW
jgi:hypothetical protein